MEISLSTHFCGFIFSLFELFSVAEAVLPSKFAPPFNDSRQSLKGLNRAEAESCAGSGKKYLTAAQADVVLSLKRGSLHMA